MALITHKHLRPEGEIGVWEIEDESIGLFEKVELTSDEKEEIKSMSDRRRKEWIAARWLIHKLSGRTIRGKCIKDSFGKPYLEDSPYKISISHSLDKVAVIASPYNVGIDIQEVVDKMERLAIKFVNKEKESWPTSLLDLHAMWGAKEAMYKAWGKKGIDFRNQMEVRACKWENNTIYSKGTLCKGDIKMHFNIYGEKIGNFVLMWAVEEHRAIGLTS